MTTTVAWYCRVSTSTKYQTTENQLIELTAYCDCMGYEVVKLYEDEVSSAKTREKRLLRDKYHIIFHQNI
jgi:DNA invertase Pin-like site-specific DNA recombinase